MQESVKLFTKTGILGRKNYFLNLIYIYMINIVLSFPKTSYLLTNSENFFDFVNFNKVYLEAGWGLKIWVILSSLFVSYLYIINSNKRFSDIEGKFNKNILIVISIITILALFSIFLPFAFSAVFSTIFCVLTLFLLFREGKITKEFPYDYKNDFNWGAFFGTWIWGLFNKSYKTLWMLLLWLTPLAFPFSVICGLKGNKWAYKNKKWEDEEKFKESQSTQTVVFVILSLVVVPLVCVIIFCVLFGFLMFGITQSTKNDPEGARKTLEKIENIADKFTSLYFESYKIEENENKFYMLPSDWAGYSFSEKKNMLDMAADKAAQYRNKNNPNSYGSYTKTRELPRTKIYSSLNGELLGEFSIDKNLFSSKETKASDYIKAAFSAYKFYKPTQK